MGVWMKATVVGLMGVAIMAPNADGQRHRGAGVERVLQTATENQGDLGLTEDQVRQLEGLLSEVEASTEKPKASWEGRMAEILTQPQQDQLRGLMMRSMRESMEGRDARDESRSPTGARTSRGRNAASGYSSAYEAGFRQGRAHEARSRCAQRPPRSGSGG